MRHQMQHLFDFYCLVCKQGVAGSIPATSTNLFYSNEIAWGSVSKSTCSRNRCSPAEARARMRSKPSRNGRDKGDRSVPYARGLLKVESYYRRTVPTRSGRRSRASLREWEGCRGPKSKERTPVSDRHLQLGDFAMPTLLHLAVGTVVGRADLKPPTSGSRTVAARSQR
jgi:hypothetical protein